MSPHLILKYPSHSTITFQSRVSSRLKDLESSGTEVCGSPSYLGNPWTLCGESGKSFKCHNSIDCVVCTKVASVSCLTSLSGVSHVLPLSGVSHVLPPSPVCHVNSNQAVLRWLLAYTLTRNPQLSKLRKHALRGSTEGEAQLDEGAGQKHL